jgi:hypothetical protein
MLLYKYRVARAQDIYYVIFLVLLIINERKGEINESIKKNLGDLFSFIGINDF